MKKIFLPLCGLSLMTMSVFASDTISVSKGWDFRGASLNIDVPKTFNDSRIKTVWSYDSINKSWNVYSPDADTNAAIDESSSIGNLTGLNIGDGYWVNSSEAYSSAYSEFIDTTIPSDIYKDPLIDVTLEIVQNKTFKVYNDDINAYENLVFDNDGIATLTEMSCNDEQTSISIKVENGNINVYENGVLDETFKILAVDTTGIVIGGKEIADEDDMHSSHGEGEVYYLLNSNASENPINMSTKLPYDMHNSYYAGEYEYFNADFTTGWAWYDSSINDFTTDSVHQSTFTIVDGVIHTEYNNSDNTYGYSDISTKQIVASIGRYDIISNNYQSTYWSKDDTITSDMTWTSYIESNNNTYNGYTFNTDGTLTSSWSEGTYEISGNTLKLNIHYNEDDCWTDEFILDASAQTITNIWNENYRSVYSSTPILELNTDYYATRILNKTAPTMSSIEQNKINFIKRNKSLF